MMLSRNDAEHAVPAEWQATFHEIAGAFAVKDYGLRDHPISGVCPVGRSTAEFIAESIEAYGDNLATLHPATWEHAIYRWMDGYWLFLVDLTTETEQVSDLTLHAKLYDTEGPRLEIESVLVR